MTNALLVASLLAVVLLGTSAGVHVGGMVALNPTLRALEPSAYVTVKQSADRCFPRLMRPLTLAGIVALLAQAVLATVDGRAGAAVVATIGLVAALFALVAVLLGDLPINERMAAWAQDSPPADWRTWRASWEHYFLLRTLGTVVAFFAAIAALTLLP